LDEAEENDILEATVQVHGLLNAVKGLASAMDEICTSHVTPNQEALSAPSGTVEVKGGKPKKAWKHDELLDTVATRVVQKSIDMETGERLTAPEDMIREIMRYAHVDYWRVKELAKLNIDADEYCEKGTTRINVIVREHEVE
jgi:hypothetical protein